LTDREQRVFEPSNSFSDPVAFRTIFFEEAQEHLANVEAILLRMDLDAPHRDDIHAIFRAVHSIKGSAAMLGCTEIAALTHLQENLLDLLRKDERPIGEDDVNAMLKAGDVLRLQVQHRRGLLPQAPDASAVEALLRERVAQPASDAACGQHGAVTRDFRVRLGPLVQAIDALELDMMLTGLGGMGALSNTHIDNRAGGSVGFDVRLPGAAADLRSVLSLVVAPEQIATEILGAVQPQPATAQPAPHRQQQAARALTAAEGLDEFFVDPVEFRRSRARAADLQPADFAAQDHAPAHDATFIRVATDKIDLLVNLVGELVITEAMLARTGAPAQGPGDERYAGGNALADLSRHTRKLQEAVLAIRMLPISNVFQRFPRLVHELSARLGKRAELKLSGEATELDRGLIEQISDPLTHLVRNAIDHGLEPPDARVACGKPPVGTVTLRASQRGGHVVIEVADDGRGLDRERILQCAAQRGMPIAPDAPDADVFQLVFEAGFSTAEHVTELSGRGVGMDVVKRNIRALGGKVDLASVAGQGTRVTVSVPLTLAIMEAMSIAIGGETYVLPLAGVVESLSVVPDELHTLPGEGETLRVRDEYLPVLHLARLFPPRKRREHMSNIAVIVEADGAKAALLVDELVGQQQVVVKSLETHFRKVPGLSGATVMGDGAVALILDISHLVRRTGREREMLA
jgi:two-component system, chemotaxis family, sensor kinase CheA